MNSVLIPMTYDKKADEETPEALPSQQRNDDCSESTTRRSERKPRLPSKILDFLTGIRATSAVELFDSSDPPSFYKDKGSLTIETTSWWLCAMSCN